MVDGSTVGVGSWVTVRDGALEESWRVVDPAEADATRRLISTNTPLARALLGVGQAFRLQRVAYPALAYLFAAGRTTALPWSLLVVNLVVVLALTGGFAIYARRNGWLPWWSLAVGLLAGLLTGTLRDLSDPLAVAAMVAGLVMWRRGTRWWAAALLTLAILAREPMALAVVAVGIDAAVRGWRGRGEPGALRRATRVAWPAVAIPAVVFIAWHAYLDARYGGNLASSSLAFAAPFRGAWDEVRHAVHDPSARNIAWDLAYLALMGAGILVALARTWRGVTASGVAAGLFGLLLLVLVFGDQWSYTRLSAPMFAALLLSGLERRDRLALGVCAAAAGLTVLAPLAPWFGAA